jgi:CheY-like chemotaxis protein
MNPHNKSILIVDDDPGVRDSYDQILSSKPVSDIMTKGKDLFAEKDETSGAKPSRQYDIRLTDCGEDGVSAVQEALSRQSPYAAAFIDMMMPGIDGAETVSKLSSSPLTVIIRPMTSLILSEEKIFFTCANPSIRPRFGNLPGP